MPYTYEEYDGYLLIIQCPYLPTNRAGDGEGGASAASDSVGEWAETVFRCYMTPVTLLSLFPLYLWIINL